VTDPTLYRQAALIDVRVILALGSEVLLMQRGDAAFDGYWNLPGGHARPLECAICAARRETTEEVGVDVAHADLLCIGASHYRPPHRQERVSFTFLAHSWAGQPATVDAAACSTVAWYRLDPTPVPLMPQAAEALRLLRINDRFSTYALECRNQR
jgi:8-oxo-dGTP diphosphatase